LANIKQIWQTPNKFGKKLVKLSWKFGVLIIGDIEQRFFGQTLCDGNFLLGAQSLVKSILCQFHQRKTHAFFVLQCPPLNWITDN